MNYTFEINIPSDSRTRRTRMTEPIRRLVRENELRPSNFILPLFASDKSANYHNEISSMPGVYQLGLDNILRESERALKQNSAALFFSA